MRNNGSSTRRKCDGPVKNRDLRVYRLAHTVTLPEKLCDGRLKNPDLREHRAGHNKTLVDACRVWSLPVIVMHSPELQVISAKRSSVPVFGGGFRLRFACTKKRDNSHGASYLPLWLRWWLVVVKAMLVWSLPVTPRNYYGLPVSRDLG